jgi:quaternary ammonium compound-resistance protein SugE
MRLSVSAVTQSAAAINVADLFNRESFFMAWLLVVVGGIFEVGFTTCMRHIDGFRNIPWTVAFVVCIGCSFLALQQASRTLPMGTAYAVWTGIGAIGTVVIGMLWYQEQATLLRGALIAVLIASIVGLKVTAGH